MNICVLISSLNCGGSSQVAVDLSRELKLKGHDVTVITLWSSNSDKYSKILKDNNVTLLSCDKKNLFDFFCYLRLKKFFREGKFDVINTHLTSLFYCFLAKPKSSVVHTIHSVPSRDIPFLYRLLMKRWFKIHHVVFVGCSKNVANKAIRCYKNHRIELIVNGFDRPQLDIKVSAEKIYDFIYVGRLVSMKNVDELMKSFSSINNNHNMSLCIVGDGPEKVKLENLCKKNKWSGITFVGHTDNVFEYLYKSKIFCLFSNYEGGPICLLEAMSCGLPVVCSDIDGNKTYVENNINGLLFKLHDVREASEKMKLLSENKELYKIISARALRTAEENSIHVTVNKYESLFKGVSNEKY